MVRMSIAYDVRTDHTDLALRFPLFEHSSHTLDELCKLRCLFRFCLHNLKDLYFPVRQSAELR